MSEPNRLVIHCGLHKTGTTALQVTLDQNRESLASASIHYPRSGIHHGGHHNLAWELTRDRRFKQARGTLGDLKYEIGNLDGNVVLSSEDFESVLHRTDQLQNLKQLARECERELHIILFIRNQVEYFESLYLELLRHGFGEDVLHHADEILNTGRLSLHEWVYQFDYRQVMQALNGVLDSKQISVGIYDSNARADIVSAFLQLMDSTLPGKLRIQPPERIHARLSLAESFQAFLQNRLGQPLRRSELKAVTRTMDKLAESRIGLGEELNNRFIERFEKGNLELCHSLGVDEKLLSTPSVSDITLPLEKIFSFEIAAELKQLFSEKRIRQLEESLTEFLP